jgi:S1-C subfamily serine protease
VILSIDGKEIASPADMTQLISRKEPGSKADLKVVRDKKEISVSVEFPKSSTGGIKI